MGVTFEPLRCQCGLTCAYQVRSGKNHSSHVNRDGYDLVATVHCRTDADGQPVAYIMGAKGKMSRRDYGDIVWWLRAKGFRVEYEHKGKQREIT